MWILPRSVSGTRRSAVCQLEVEMRHQLMTTEASQYVATTEPTTGGGPASAFDVRSASPTGRGSLGGKGRERAVVKLCLPCRPVHT